MKDWRIKEISDLTKTSVRMLRHYDEIDLLKPSYRAANGYRYYTAEDLAKLQQIIALKYFGFSLEAIKNILQKHHNIYAHLKAQQQVISEQFIHLQQVNCALKDVLKRLSPLEVPNWHDLIKLIEGYSMNIRDKLKEGWAGRELNETQFEEYLFFYEKFPQEFAQRDEFISQINNNQLDDPTGPDGERVVTFFYDIAKKLKNLFPEQAKLGSSLLESMKSGKLTTFELTPEGALWLGRATTSFWLKRWNQLYDKIVKNLKTDPQGKTGKKIAADWTDLTDEFLAVGSKSFFTGMLLWQELARQEHELNELKGALSPQDMLKPYHIKLIFNPDAISWISKALEVHSS